MGIHGKVDNNEIVNHLFTSFMLELILVIDSLQNLVNKASNLSIVIYIPKSGHTISIKQKKITMKVKIKNKKK